MYLARRRNHDALDCVSHSEIGTHAVLLAPGCSCARICVCYTLRGCADNRCRRVGNRWQMRTIELCWQRCGAQHRLVLLVDVELGLGLGIVELLVRIRCMHFVTKHKCVHFHCRFLVVCADGGIVIVMIGHEIFFDGVLDPDICNVSNDTVLAVVILDVEIGLVDVVLMWCA